MGSLLTSHSIYLYNQINFMTSQDGRKVSGKHDPIWESKVWYGMVCIMAGKRLENDILPVLPFKLKPIWKVCLHLTPHFYIIKLIL